MALMAMAGCSSVSLFAARAAAVGVGGRLLWWGGGLRAARAEANGRRRLSNSNDFPAQTPPPPTVTLSLSSSPRRHDSSHSGLRGGMRLPGDWREAKKFLKEIDQTERRKYYNTKEFITLDKIQTWKSFTEAEKLKQPESKYKKDDILNGKVSLFQGDITKLEIDAIVNAANSSLLGGGGVDGSIHRAAGELLRNECSMLGGCHTGDAKISCGYCLPATHVIHTVGPNVQDAGNLPSDQLLSCYKTSLKLAKDNNLRTIAFPCISTGIYGYPNKPASDVALGAVRDYLEENRDSFDRVIFCVFLDVDEKLYKEKMASYFPHGGRPQSKL